MADTSTVTKRPRGRPRLYKRAIADEICRRMAAGETLRGVCRSPGMPPPSTVRHWVLDDVDGFAARYAHARRELLDHWAEEIVQIADESGADVSIDAEGRMHISGEAINRARLRVDTRKWLLSKLRPTEYGEKQAIEHTGKDGGPIATTVKPDVTQLPTEILEMLRNACPRA